MIFPYLLDRVRCLHIRTVSQSLRRATFTESRGAFLPLLFNRGIYTASGLADQVGFQL